MKRWILFALILSWLPILPGQAAPVKWVDFGVSYESLCYAMDADIASASREKHIPVVTVNDRVVRAEVGSVVHPMSEEHSILWISLETDKGVYRKHLAPTEAPVAEFLLAEGETPVAVFAYCNLHGLWKSEI